jgi:hypothetical protein
VACNLCGRHPFPLLIAPHFTSVRYLPRRITGGHTFTHTHTCSHIVCSRTHIFTLPTPTCTHARTHAGSTSTTQHGHQNKWTSRPIGVRECHDGMRVSIFLSVAVACVRVERDGGRWVNCYWSGSSMCTSVNRSGECGRLLEGGGGC